MPEEISSTIAWRRRLGFGDFVCWTRRQKKRRRGRNIFWLLLENRSGQAVVGVVIYAAAPPSDRTIGQQVSRLHCALCCERVWVWAQGLSRGLKIPTNGLRDPQERF